MMAASIQKIINPSNSEIIAEIPLAQSKDLELVLTQARQAFDQGPWLKLPLKERKELILNISRGILDKAGELANLETLNTGKPIKESTFMDIPSSAKVFEYFANNLERLLESETVQLENAQSRLVREPRGVVLLIVPWNYPLLIASWKMSQALAAGNVVILKPSSLTPLTALELGKIACGAGLPVGVANVVNASGDSVGETLCSDKRVDMISFTGSNIVGKEILGYASKNVKKLTLELGGKSASIILKDADLEVAVNSALCSIFLNQGQMCTAMSRIFIEDDIYDKFVIEFVKKTKQIKLGPGLDYETQMGPLISESQRKKVLGYVEKAKKEGARLLCGGKIPGSPELKKGFFLEPAVLAEVKPVMSVFQEEVFGPVAIVNKFSSPDEVIDLANNSDFGLAASIWTKDACKANEMAGKINAGIVWVNTYGMFYPEAPYGGFKQSGFGKELGREGFLEYARLKNIFVDKTPDSKPLVNFWYGF
ncbi:MAG: aldehyde dehydrogenase family protein [Candidatus Omnitrophota bacterium]